MTSMAGSIAVDRGTCLPTIAVRTLVAGRLCDDARDQRHGFGRRGEVIGLEGHLGRVGLVGQGVVAAIIGILAIQLAMGDPNEATTKDGAVAWLAEQPAGKFLLVLLTVALFALAIWRFLDAIRGDPVEGDKATSASSSRPSASCTRVRGHRAVRHDRELDRRARELRRLERRWCDQASQKAASTVLDWPAGQWRSLSAGSS